MAARRRPIDGERLRALREERSLAQADLAMQIRTRCRDGAQCAVTAGTVSRWELGRQAPGPAHLRALCDVFEVSARVLVVGPPASADEAPDHDAQLAAPLCGGLEYQERTDDSLDVVSRLWAWEARHTGQDPLPTVAYDSGATGSALARWLLADVTRRDTTSAAGPITDDILEIRDATAFFVRWDSGHGGGSMRHAAVHYLVRTCLPLLRGRYAEQVRRELFSTVASMARVIGWMSHDAGLEGLAQRHLIQSLRLAEAAGDRTLGAVTLATLSDQARYHGDARLALDLARAGQDGAGDAWDVRIRCLLAEARAHALLVRSGDTSAAGPCLAALGRAEDALEQRRGCSQYLPAFDEGKLATEQAHAYLDLSSTREGWARNAVSSALRALELRDASFVRGRSLTRLTLARAHLRMRETDAACALGHQVLDEIQGVRSSHPRAYLQEFQAELQPYEGHQGVAELRERARLRLAS